MPISRLATAAHGSRARSRRRQRSAGAPEPADRRLGDRVGGEVERAVEVRLRAGLAEAIDAERHERQAERGAEEREVARRRVVGGDERRAALRGLHESAQRAARLGAADERAEHQVARRDVEHARADVLGGEQVARRERLGHERAARGDHDPPAVEAGRRLGEPVGTGEHARAHRLAALALDDAVSASWSTGVVESRR